MAKNENYRRKQDTKRTELSGSRGNGHTSVAALSLVERALQTSNFYKTREEDKELTVDFDEEDSVNTEFSEDEEKSDELIGDTPSKGNENGDEEIKDTHRQTAADMLKSNLFQLSTRNIPSDADLVRKRLDNSYRNENGAILLHGYLHVQIIRATNLRNADPMSGLLNPTLCGSFTPVSDPYVTVHAGIHRLVKTPTIENNLNPEWNLDYFVPVSHPIKQLEFRVKDQLAVSSKMLGKCSLPVQELIRFSDNTTESDDENPMQGDSSSAPILDKNEDHAWDHRKAGKPAMMRTGCLKTAHLDGTPRHGSLEYFVEFIPKELIHDLPTNKEISWNKSAQNLAVPGVYFPLREGNHLRYYIDADDRGEAVGTPPVGYGEKGIEKIWKPRRYFRDVYDSLCEAETMVYILGWSVDFTLSLLRGSEEIDGLNKRKVGGTYSPVIGELLNQKADEGVVVNVMVWDDMTSNAVVVDGVIGTRDEQLRDYFEGSKVTLRLVPMGSGNSNLLKKLRLSVYYTHHQKCVIVDNANKELLAYVGGIDLTYGRYDDGSYPLFRTLGNDHKDDFHNACAKVTKESGPRQPWHDIHSRVQGPGTLDLLKNFEERWLGQGGTQAELVNLDKSGVGAKPTGGENDGYLDTDSWNTQLFRSIDEKTAKLTEQHFDTIPFEETKGVTFDQAQTFEHHRFLPNLSKTGPEKVQHFVSANASPGIEVSRPLETKRRIHVDNSAHKALVHHIRNAQHSIYIESQYFLSSSFLWEEEKTPLCCNLVAAEITWKICEKIEAGERFTAYIVVPMWPEGLPDATSVQDILRYQALTMKSMYKRIHQSIDRRKQKLETDKEGDEFKAFCDTTPSDYLNFYCLANRETKVDGEETTFDGHSLLHRTRRHLVYTHSKMTIVDDAVILCGSANINQRSLAGTRDSELLMGSWQPHHLASKDSVATGDIHGFRLHCWAHLTGTMVDTFRQPSSLKCVRLLNKLAQENWNQYTQEETCDMQGYLIPYPVDVLQNGDVVPSTRDGKFPDTDGNIMGRKGILPKYLTT